MTIRKPQTVGSRMIASRIESLLSQSRRWALVLVCGVACITLLGATQPVAPVASHNSITVTTPAIEHGTTEHAAANVVATPASAVVVDTDRELLQESSTAALETETASLKSHKKTVWMVVTAYCSCTKCCGTKARGLTASGRSIAYNAGRFVAADTKLFKFGTQIQIPGYAGGEAVEVIDRGSAIKGYHIDLFFPSHQQAKEWGKRWMAVTIVD